MAPPKKENTEKISVLLPPDVLQKVIEDAAEKGMKVSGMIRMIVMEYYKSKK